MSVCAREGCRRKVSALTELCFAHGGRVSIPPNPSGICVCGCGRVTPLAKQTRGDVPKGQHGRFVGPGCATRYRLGLTSRAKAFWSKVERSDGCWLWKGYTNQDGYGIARYGGATFQAHRFGYELLVGPIPSGLELDHLCHTNDETCIGGPDCPHRPCVNPDHLEPVTQEVNNQRIRWLTKAARRAQNEALATSGAKTEIQGNA